MKFLFREVHLGDNDLVQVSLDHAANVRLLDACNFERYRRGENHRYFGGYAKASPVRLAPPHAGRWFIAVDLGGYSGHVRVDIQVVALN